MIFDGRQLANKILEEIKKETNLWPQKPSVAVVSFGAKKDNSSYIIQKRKTAESLGFGFKHYHYSKDDFSKARVYLNKIVKMENVSAVVVQMPLPAEINTSILNVIPPEKDPDLLSDRSVGMFFNEHSLVNPPTAEAILDILKEENISLSGKKIALLGYGRLVGRFLVPMLIKEGATVSIIDKNTPKEQVKQISLGSDIVISAVGEANLIKGDMLKSGAVVIDAGFSILDPALAGKGGVDGKIVGDVDLDSVKDKISLITPVPGGVGPITVARLFSNVAKLFKYSTKFKN
ncbi:MAG: bifunctional 5,10-methylenetetrahydrofolate dehydrogenase/5,10-methenyltetrahydrofolate cyclohydrolase [bacterium]|nr:bifunctional 5,10-methylenetetrahydrofolate dehydrogenase/5,10-methenyltetrahydrofolate cyclohydrolase [bacterium]